MLNFWAFLADLKISSASRSRTPPDATAGRWTAAQLEPTPVGSARAASSRPYGPGHSSAAADVAVVVSGNVELMTQKEVLDFKPAPRPKQVGDKRPKQLKECKHRAG